MNNRTERERAGDQRRGGGGLRHGGRGVQWFRLVRRGSYIETRSLRALWDPTSSFLRPFGLSGRVTHKKVT